MRSFLYLSAWLYQQIRQRIHKLCLLLLDLNTLAGIMKTHLPILFVKTFTNTTYLFKNSYRSQLCVNASLEVFILNVQTLPTKRTNRTRLLLAFLGIKSNRIGAPHGRKATGHGGVSWCRKIASFQVRTISTLSLHGLLSINHKFEKYTLRIRELYNFKFVNWY